MRRAAPLALLAALAAALLPAPARASLGPLTDIKTSWADTALPVGEAGLVSLRVRDIGDQDLGSSPLMIEDRLPAGVTATAVRSERLLVGGEVDATHEAVKIPLRLSEFCSGAGTSTVLCEVPLTAPATYGGQPATAFVLPELGRAPGDKYFVEFPFSAGGGYPEPSGWLPAISIDVAVAPGASGANVARVEGGGAPTATDTDQVPFGAEPAAFGLLPGSFEADAFSAAYPFGQPSRQAGAHPFEQRVNADFSERTKQGFEGLEKATIGIANGLVRNVEVTLPQGMVGNPEALPKCDPALFAQLGATTDSTRCPPDTQLGYLDALLGTGGLGFLSRVAIYNLDPPYGTPVDLGFLASGFVQGHIYATLDPTRGYAIRSLSPDIGALIPVSGFEATFWGVPADPAHDRFRYYAEKQPGEVVTGAPWEGKTIRPFFTNPSDCGEGNGGARIRVNTYEHPGTYTPTEEWPSPLDVEGCENARFRFEPKIALEPSDLHAGAPTGLEVHLEVPQGSDEAKSAAELYAEEADGSPKEGAKPKAIATPPIKEAVVTFPEGMTLNPSAAQGLEGCSLAQIKLGTNEPVSCPAASRYGTLTLHTPIFPPDAPLTGHIYIAAQNDNPNRNLLSLYLVIEEPRRGILVKIPGRVDLNEGTGQITTTFKDLPQFPVSDMQLSLKGGVRAGLVEPSTCGTKTITATFYSWQDPSTPHSVKSTYEVTQRPDGSPCARSLAERPFKPSLVAGTENPLAGAYSPFLARLTRTDEEQELSRFALTLPPGLVAKFAGIATCPEAGIAQALARSKPGEGALELKNPSCPAASLLGTTEVGAGTGQALTYVPGKLYLAGPYEGAPLSLVAITPAAVGPFDLGVVAVRSAIAVNPQTAQGTATTDPLPQILAGVPVRIRDLRVALDRQGFTLNPTSCEAMQITAQLSATAAVAEAASRFQAAECGALGFKPSLSLRLNGKSGRGAHPKLQATLKMPPGDANIASAAVTLPRSEFLDQGHIKTDCTRVQFAAHECPPGSIYGWAVAKTPLFDQPLEGPVYLRANGGERKLPDLVAALHGPASQPVEVDLVGFIDSGGGGGIRTRFQTVPDAPVSEFTLTMQGGAKGLIQNSKPLCAAPQRASARFAAHNGKLALLQPKLNSACPKKHARKAAARSGS